MNNTNNINSIIYYLIFIKCIPISNMVLSQSWELMKYKRIRMTQNANFDGVFGQNAEIFLYGKFALIIMI